MAKFIELSVNSRIYNFSCKLYRRLTVITGDSAGGKTTLVEVLTGTIPGVTVKCSLNVKPVNEVSWESMLMKEKDTILFFDDLTCVETKHFADMCKKFLVKNNLYLVIIDRAISQFDFEAESKNLDRLSISVNEIYEMKNDGNNYWLEAVEIPVTNDFSNFDCILSEDSGNGFLFFNTFIRNVVAATNGKDSIIQDVKELIRVHSKILVMIDLATFGCHWNEFRQRFRYTDAVYVLPDRECFEQMLLESNFLNRIPEMQTELRNPIEYANRFISWETYYEDLIYRITVKRFYCCTHKRHSRLSDCYLSSCAGCNPSKKSKCDFIDKDKHCTDRFTQMFENTKFEKILELPRKDEENTESMHLF